jgi:glycosyltransferase involved in cell wall biosynthesis
MTKLLIIFPSIERGGAEEYALTIACGAKQQGWEVHAAFPKTKGTASLIQDFTVKGISYHCLAIPQRIIHGLKAVIIEYLPQFVRTVSLLFNIKPDVAIVNLPFPSLCLGSVLACGLLGIPTTVVFQLITCRIPFKSNRLRLYNWARARNQQWIAVSKNNRKLVSESFQIPLHEVLCIYNGTKLISVCDREDIGKLRHQVCQELGVPENSQIALTVARLHPQKGHSDLIPAIPHIVREFPEVRFVWVGDGEQREYLIHKVQEYGVEDKVLFLGYRSDVPRLLKSANLFIFPTHCEGHPFALLEAMAHRLPVIASDASGIPEVIENGVHGLLFRTGDSCDLLENLRWGLRNPDKMQQMAQNAQLRVQEFSEERMLKQTLGVLAHLRSTQV